MAKLSISKSVGKRLKITGSGRTLHRPKGLCHARANKTAKQMGRKRGYRKMSRGSIRSPQNAKS